MRPHEKNLHTEVEARELWCPMARLLKIDGDNNYGLVAAAVNRWWSHKNKTTDNNPKPCRCIASECALWRWTTYEKGHCGLVGGGS